MQHLTITITLIFISVIFSACGSEYNACVAVYEMDQSSWCVMDTKAECDGIDEDDGWSAKYYEGESCEDRGYPVDCENGAWEDNSIECS